MPLLFVDDTNLFASGTDLKSSQTCVNKDLSAIAEWLKAYKLSLNVKKNTLYDFPRQKETQLPHNINNWCWIYKLSW